MRKQEMRNKWTKENINDLKNAYIHGSPLKQIAAKLNRSVSAINKVLARHNLRTHQKMDVLPSILRPTANQILQKRGIGTKIRKSNLEPPKSLRADYREWVHFDSVIYWLREQGISVIKSKNDTYYEINGYPRSKEQILLIANLHREKNHLTAFFVKGVTHL